MESPIEFMLANVAASLGGNCFKISNDKLDIDGVIIASDGALVPVIYSQVYIGVYRADFVFSRTMLNGHKQVCVVECDGHNFHEKTKEQARHDKARDRYFTKRGLRVLRFTGSEIYRDPAACLSEIVEVLS